MTGRRLYCDDWGDFFLDGGHTRPCAAGAAPGDYWRGPLGWAARPPNGLRCGLGGHRVTEHGDGTITVSPSILLARWGWHGHLERGVWREVQA